MSSSVSVSLRFVTLTWPVPYPRRNTFVAVSSVSVSLRFVTLDKISVNKQTARVGNVLSVAVPAHGTHDVQVPAGTRPEAGEMLTFILPASAGPVLTHQKGTERHAPASVLVIVPASAHEGDLLQVAVPGFGRRTVRVPPGVHSGEVVEFRVATTSGLIPPLRKDSADSAASLYHRPRVSTAPRSPIDLKHAPGLLSLSGLDAIPPAAIRRSRALRHAVTRASGTPEAGGGGGGGSQQSPRASDHLFSSKRAPSLQSLAPARMQQHSDVRRFPAFSQQRNFWASQNLLETHRLNTESGATKTTNHRAESSSASPHDFAPVIAGSGRCCSRKHGKRLPGG
jgi:hypothetical protein